MIGSGMNVGEIRATFGTDFDDDGVRRWERSIDEAERRARKGVDARMGADVDERGFGVFRRNLQNAEKDSRSFSERHAKGLAVGKAALIGLGGAAGLTAIGIKKAAEAFGESEKSSARMQAQLKAQHISWAEHRAQIDATIAKHAQLGAFDDEDLQDSFTALVRATGDVNSALKLNETAMDLARAKQMEVSAAGELVSKVYNGQYRALRQLGIEFTPTTAAQDRLKASTDDATEAQEEAAKKADKLASRQQALALVQQKVGGQAREYGRTQAAGMDRARNAIENLLEKVGERLAPAITKVSNWLAKFVDEMREGTGQGGRFVDRLKEGFETARDVAQRLWSAVEPIVGFFMDHPKMIAVAVGAWATYRVAAMAATAKTKLAMLGLFRGADLTDAAAAGGAAAGTGFGGKAAGLATKALKFAGWAGLGVTIGDMLGLNISGRLEKWLGDAKRFAIDEPKLKLAPGGARALDDYFEGLKRVRQEYERLDRAKPDLRDLNQQITLGKREVNGLYENMVNLDRGSREYKQSADRLKVAQELLNAKIGVRGAAKDVGELRTRLSKLDEGSNAYRATARRLMDAQERLNNKLEAAEAAGRKGAGGVAKMGTSAHSTSEGIGAAAGAIASNVDRLARELDGQGVNFTVTKTPPFGGMRLARGGHVVGGDPNARGRDDRLLLGPDGRPEAVVGAGELLVFNADQVAAVKEAINARFGVSLGEFYAAPWKPHHLAHAKGGQIPNFYLSGPAGDYRDVGNRSLSKLDRVAEAFVEKLGPKWGGGATARFVDRLLKATGGWDAGLRRGSGYRDPATNAAVGGSPTSNHMKGSPANPGAWDIPVMSGGPLDRYGDALAAGARRAGVPEVIWEAPDHFDHVHLGFFSRGGLLRLGKGGELPGWAETGKGSQWSKAQSSTKTATGRNGGLAKREQRISDLERSYGQFERSFAMNDVEMVVEDENGAHIDQAALDDRTGDLKALRKLRQKIRNQIDQYQKAVKAAVETYERAIKRVREALSAVPDKIPGKGKRAKDLRETAARRRETYGRMLGNLTGRKGELSEIFHDIGFDLVDADLDVAQLDKEIGGLDPSAVLPGAAKGGDGVWRTTDPVEASIPEAASDGAGGAFTPEVPDASTNFPDPQPSAPSAPTPEDIATAANQQVQAFLQGSEQAFAEFGSNAVRAGANPFGSEVGLMAGLRHYGADQDAAPRVQQIVQVTVRDVGEMHVMTRSALHELQAAVG